MKCRKYYYFYFILSLRIHFRYVVLLLIVNHPIALEYINIIFFFVIPFEPAATYGCMVKYGC